MESSNGPNSGTKQQNQNLESKRLNRTPSPARPLLKDIHSRSSSSPSGITPQSPKLSSAGLLVTQSRISTRTGTGAKYKRSSAISSSTKSLITKKTAKVVQNKPSDHKSTNKQDETNQHVTKSEDARINQTVVDSAHISLGHGSTKSVSPGVFLRIVSRTDSSSDLPDLLLGKPKLSQASNRDAESGTDFGHQLALTDSQGTSSPEPSTGPRSLGVIVAPSDLSSSLTNRDSNCMLAKGYCSGELPTVRSKPYSKLTNSIISAPALCTLNGSKVLIEEDLFREIEDLRSENDYLKDEVDELRAEMEEVRDSYLEEEVQQLQELRCELDRANKNCRILQYRLRKAEQRGLHVVPEGQVDGQLVRTLEQDLKVAKDVYVRLHNELQSMDERRSRAEEENELLRQKIIEIGICKQALQKELEREKESSLKKRGIREPRREKKPAVQEDSVDLICQLQFAKEESALTRKKMARLGREKDKLEQDLQSYRAAYGDAGAPPPGESGQGTREAQLKQRLRLVEEEANIMVRKMVELEVENRGLREENEDIRSQCGKGCAGREPIVELRRHLQFVEEEADLLRHTISEVEDRNRQLNEELHLLMSGTAPPQEELKSPHLQIGELSRKAMKLLDENRVLVSSDQRCDVLSHAALRTAVPSNDTVGKRNNGYEEVGSLLPVNQVKEGPIGGESYSEGPFDESPVSTTVRESCSNERTQRKPEDLRTLACSNREPECHEETVNQLITDAAPLVDASIHMVPAGQPPEWELLSDRDSAEGNSQPLGPDVHNGFMEKVHHIEEGTEEYLEDLSPMSNILESIGPFSTVSSVPCNSPIGNMERNISNFQDTLGLQSQEWAGAQERRLTQQELRLLRCGSRALYAGLRGALGRWRQGHASNRGEQEDNLTECDYLEKVPELDLPMDSVNKDGVGDTSEPHQTSELLLSLKQLTEEKWAFHALRMLLDEFRWELQDEVQQCGWLQQAHSNKEATGEEHQAETKCQTNQRGVNITHGVGIPSGWSDGDFFSAFTAQNSHPEPTTPSSACTASPVHFHNGTEAPSGDHPEAMRGAESFQPAENLLLDALLLDPLSKSAVPRPSGIFGKRRVSNLKEADNGVSEEKGLSALHGEGVHGGSLLRVKSVSSMSEFQCLMDTSPFLHGKGADADQGREEPTPPLSPDDLKYIEEFKSKGRGFLSTQVLSGAPGVLPEAWVESQENEPTSKLFQPASRRPAASPAATFATPSSLEPCQNQVIRDHVGVDPSKVSALHNHLPASESDRSWLLHNNEWPIVEPVFGSKSKGGDDEGDGGEAFMWPPCGSRKHKSDPSSSLRDLDLSRNLSDDLKSVAFSVRDSDCSCHTGRSFTDAACQTNSFSNRGTQTTQRINVGLQTEVQRNIASSPNQCLIPKGGRPNASYPSSAQRKSLLSHGAQNRSAKYGPPKLRHIPPTKMAQSTRVVAVTLPQKGYGGSAWARSTTTRDSPVLSATYDGPSSLFNIIDHTAVAHDALQKAGKTPSKPRCPAHTETHSPGLAVVQTNVRERSPSPFQLIPDLQGEKNPEANCIRQDLLAPSSYTHAGNAAKNMNKRSVNEEKRLSQGGQVYICKEDKPRDENKGQQKSNESCLLGPALPAT